MTFHLTGVERQRGQYSYRVKETADGTPWIAGEPAGDPLKIIGTDGSDLEVGFTLRPGTTYQEALEVAKCTNEWIAEIVVS